MQWIARGEIELPDHDEWLSDREREQVASIRFTKRRQEYLTRRWAAKHAVATAVDGGPPGPARLAAIEIRNHASGAPWVAVDDRAVEIEVSLTDRAGWAVCLVGRPGMNDVADRIGVDLELAEPRSEGFIDDFLTSDEQDYVRSRDTLDARHAAANLLWSAKEAALKVLQVGLRADTRTIEVSVGDVGRDDGWAPLTMRSRVGDDFSGWWRRDGEFVLTVAARRPIAPPAAMSGSADLRRAEPLHSWLDRPLA